MILVINCGSSSLKLAVFNEQLENTASGLAERLGQAEATARFKTPDTEVALPARSDHQQALEAMVDTLRSTGVLSGTPVAIGHRVVHGGETFREAALIDDQVQQAIEDCASLAPLHNPVNLTGIRATRTLFADVPQVAVFDTAFHHTLPEQAYRYALPDRFYQDWGIRRYGFHGTSHYFMLSETARLLDRSPSNVSLISAHLGNGCSVTAIRDGKSVDTSMGLTPLEGLVMGTRSGDVDPGLFDFLRNKGISGEEVHRILNNESGLLGLSGESNDMRSLEELSASGHQQAALAIDVFCFRLARYIGAMCASLERLDALVFTGGIGENSANVRARTVAHLQLMGISLDDTRNRQHGRNSNRAISDEHSRFPVMVIPTNEERVIAEEALKAARSN
jgi:acetate kinase